MKKITAFKSKKLLGNINVPGDKSISHRSIIISSYALGESKIYGLLEGEDVISTIKALQSMGVKITKKDNYWSVIGSGINSLNEPNNILDMGNSGTSARLLIGMVSTYNFNSFFSGDDSLRKRPMARVTKPLSKINVNFITASNNKLPLVVCGNNDNIPVNITLDIPSAQVKSALILACLNIEGTSTIIDPFYSRDHTERMLKYYNADINVYDKNNASVIEVNGNKDLEPQEFTVPGDFSSAAFVIAAALIVPDSKVTINNICINEQRIGLYYCLKEMNANIKFINNRIICGENVADIVVEYTDNLQAIDIPPQRATSMIDEYPILAVIASTAKGITKITGVEELKVKESNRFNAIIEGLTKNGITVNSDNNTIEIQGQKEIKGGAIIYSNLDHRIAMSFSVLGLISEDPITIQDADSINTSFPNFIELMNNINAKIKE